MINLTSQDDVYIGSGNMQCNIHKGQHGCLEYLYSIGPFVHIVDIEVNGIYTIRKIIHAPSRVSLINWIRSLDDVYRVVGIKSLEDVELDTDIPEKKTRPNFVDMTDTHDEN